MSHRIKQVRKDGCQLLFQMEWSGKVLIFDVLDARLEAKRGIKYNLSWWGLAILNKMGKWEESDFPRVLSIISIWDTWFQCLILISASNIYGRTEVVWSLPRYFLALALNN